MSTLQFRKVTRDVEHFSFDCGVESINHYVKDSYYPTIVQDAYAYTIEYQNIIVGFFQLAFREIELDDFPNEISEYDSGVKNQKISAAHIRFIAIDSKFQNHNIGTNVLRIIIKKVKMLSEEWPIRVITVDALCNLEKWYEKEGFKKMVHNTEGQEGTTQAMYFDCLNNTEELMTYVDSVCE